MRLIDVKQVAEKLGVSIRTIYRMVESGDLPAPVKLSTRSQRWVEHEVDEHLVNLPRGKKCAVGFLPDGTNCALQTKTPSVELGMKTEPKEDHCHE